LCLGKTIEERHADYRGLFSCHIEGKWLDDVRVVLNKVLLWEVNIFEIRWRRSMVSVLCLPEWGDQKVKLYLTLFLGRRNG
jgi:hypothetical protein